MQEAQILHRSFYNFIEYSSKKPLKIRELIDVKAKLDPMQQRSDRTVLCALNVGANVSARG